MQTTSYTRHESAQLFLSFSQLTVRQRKSWTEILSGLEIKNTYDVFDQTGKPVLTVRETSKGITRLLQRMFLGPFRPFECDVTTAGSGNPILILSKPFRFIYHELRIASRDGTAVGTIRRRWTWFSRCYDICDSSGRLLAEIHGPIFRPWTFNVLIDNVHRATIAKRWSGLGREMFTTADNFGVEMTRIGDSTLRALIFAATTLIDIVHFERSN